MKVLAVIPARGGSKGIPLKNIVQIAGRPLLEWTIDAALACPGLGLTVVSTDHPEIAKCAEKAGVRVVNRPPELAQEDTPTAPVIKHAWSQACLMGFEADVVMTLQPTSPLRRPDQLTQALDLFSRYPNADSLVSIQRLPHQFGPEMLMNLSGPWAATASSTYALRRQDKQAYWARNGAAIYLTRAMNLQEFIWGGKTLAFEMDKISSIDIDDLDDLKIAEGLLNCTGRG
ncbi:NeuA CMP-N-acetylneuraminic acid synthetase [Burkholderiales bacterium]|jgi:N-acylneuraminate cytidylyltransferase